jgi:hypothetical protein
LACYTGLEIKGKRKMIGADWRSADMFSHDLCDVAKVFGSEG